MEELNIAALKNELQRLAGQHDGPKRRLDEFELDEREQDTKKARIQPNQTQQIHRHSSSEVDHAQDLQNAQQTLSWAPQNYPDCHWSNVKAPEFDTASARSLTLHSAGTTWTRIPETEPGVAELWAAAHRTSSDFFNACSDPREPELLKESPLEYSANDATQMNAPIPAITDSKRRMVGQELVEDEGMALTTNEEPKKAQYETTIDGQIYWHCGDSDALETFACAVNIWGLANWAHTNTGGS